MNKAKPIVVTLGGVKKLIFLALFSSLILAPVFSFADTGDSSNIFSDAACSLVQSLSFFGHISTCAHSTSASVVGPTLPTHDSLGAALHMDHLVSPVRRNTYPVQPNIQRSPSVPVTQAAAAINSLGQQFVSDMTTGIAAIKDNANFVAQTVQDKADSVANSIVLPAPSEPAVPGTSIVSTLSINSANLASNTLSAFENLKCFLGNVLPFVSAPSNCSDTSASVASAPVAPSTSAVTYTPPQRPLETVTTSTSTTTTPAPTSIPSEPTSQVVTKTVTRTPQPQPVVENNNSALTVTYSGVSENELTTKLVALASALRAERSRQADAISYSTGQAVNNITNVTNVSGGSSFDVTVPHTWTALQTFGNTTASQVTATTICLTGDICRTTWPVGGAGGAAYPFAFAGNATSTLTQFNGGLTAYASTTIGNGTTLGGLTVNGAATTTTLHIGLGTGALVGSNIQGVNNQNGAAGFAVHNSTSGNETGMFAGASGDGSIGSVSNNAFNILANNQKVATFLPGGNLGLGTLLPNYTLEVYGTASTTNLYVSNATSTNATSTNFFATNASTTNFYGAGLTNCNSASNALIYTSASGRFGCNTIVASSPTSKWATSTDNTSIYMNSATKLGIGTSTPPSRLTIATSTAYNAAFPDLLIGPRGLVSGSANGTLIGANTDNFTGNLIDLQVNGTTQFKVSSAGVVNATGDLGANNIFAYGNFVATNGAGITVGGNNTRILMNGSIALQADTASNGNVLATPGGTGVFAVTTGKSGFGTSTPFSALSIATTTLSNAAFPIGLNVGPNGLVSGAAGGTLIGSNTQAGFAGSFIDLQNNGTDEFRVDSAGTIFGAGNLNIGSISTGQIVSNYVLGFSGGGGHNTGIGSRGVEGNLVISEDLTGGDNGGLKLLQLGGLTSAFPAFSQVNQAVVLKLANGTDGGYFAVGTSTPRAMVTFASSTASQLTLSDATKSSNPWNFRASGNFLYLATSSPSTFATSTTAALSLDTNGVLSLGNYANCNGASSALGITAGVVQCDTGVSDQRLKKDITPIANADALGDIMKLKPVSFYFKDLSLPNTHAPEQQYGFLAQDVQQIFPNLVGLTAPTYLTPTGTLTLNKDGLIAQVVSAVQQVNTKVDGLTTAIGLDLNNASAGLSIPNAVIMHGGLTVDSIGSIGDILALQSDVNFIGRPYFNSDTGGIAIVRQGSRQVDVAFDKSYISAPVISASITLNASTTQSQTDAILAGSVGYVVTNRSQTGFSILLSTNAPADMQFSWIALAIQNMKIFDSVNTLQPNTNTITSNNNSNNSNTNNGGGSSTPDPVTPPSDSTSTPPTDSDSSTSTPPTDTVTPPTDQSTTTPPADSGSSDVTPPAPADAPTI